MAELDGRSQSGERAKGRDLIYAVVDEILDGDGRILLRVARLGECRGLRRATREIAADIPRLPDPEAARTPLHFSSYRWQQHCRGLYQTPIAA